MATIRQQAMRVLYPFIMKLTQWAGKQTTILKNETNQVFKTPIYDLALILNNGTPLPLQTLKGKKILIVNTASNCGYTAQYIDLQQLQQQYADTLQVIGFPANDFKEQEQGSDESIAQFCQVNFGVAFPLAKKSSVVKGAQQHPVFQWLTQREKNGWNEKTPSWNFSKYLVNEHGLLTHYFDPSVAPLSPAVRQAVEA
ncbi:MAG TPA: glutathione peroxidase [Chitinophagaceae bacterium]|nr:glutathione peroxidase [Chitinophagaceae bacterium]